MIGNRKPRFTFTLLNRFDEPLKDLDGVISGSLEIVALSPLGVSGEMVLRDLDQGIDFLSDRLRITYDPGTGDEPWPVGTVMMVSGATSYDDFGITHEVQLLSKMQVLAEATVDYGYSIPAGTNIVNKIVELIQSTGETRIAVTESSKTLVNALAFNENESILDVVSTLANAADYWQPWTDGSGQFRVEPYEDPKDRAVFYEFLEGETAIHLPDWGREQDRNAVPNVVKVRRSGTDDTPGIQGVAINNDPASPFSTVSRGREITKTYEEEVVDQTTANNLAKRYLEANMAPVAHLKVTHGMVPLEPHQRVQFVSQGVDTSATVRRMSFTFDEFTLMDSEWAEI